MRGVPVTGIAGRVFLYTAAIVCAVLFAALGMAVYSGARAARETERRGVEQAADLTAQLLAGRERSLAGGARVFVQGPYFRSLVAARRRDDILDQALEAADQLGADWVFITDDRGVLLAKSDEPGVQDAAMGGIPLVAGALEGRTTSGYGVSGDTLLFQAVAVPIVVPGVAPVGVLVATKAVDARTARDVRAATGADVAFYIVATSGAARLAATSLPTASSGERLLHAAIASSGSARGRDRDVAREARIGGTPYVLQGAAMTTSGGEVVGGFVVGRPREGMARQLAGIRQSLLVAGLLGLALALLAAWSAARRVTRPARALAAAASRALDGEYETAARAAVEATAGAPRDEVAALAWSLAALLEELREKQSLVSVLGRAATPTGRTTPAALSPELGSSRGIGRRRSGPATVARALHAEATLRGVAAFAPGAVVADRYALARVLGSGGTGIVYQATDLALDETVALKVLRPELVAGEPEAIDELKGELRLTRRISHRNVVRTHDFGVSDGVPFLTMEYVEGASLADVLAERGALPPAVTLALAKQLARALEAAHEQGIMHGDIKPANLLVTLDGRLKVTDFGVATLVRRPWTTRARERDAASPPQVAGAVVGTPEYMAPELLLGSPPDPRTDLYSMGLVLQECMTGATPFQRDTPRGFLARKLEPAAPAAPPMEARPTSLEALAAQLTLPDPDDRPATAAAVLALLARIG